MSIVDRASSGVSPSLSLAPPNIVDGTSSFPFSSLTAHAASPTGSKPGWGSKVGCIDCSNESDTSLSAASLPARDGLVSVAYYGNWDIYARKYGVNELPVDQITHLMYAFATLDTNGTVCLSDVQADLGGNDQSAGDTRNLRGNLGQLFELKKKHRHLKVLLSVGGWTYGSMFAGWVETASGRERFAKSALDLLQNYGLDGLDIDWEYPTSEAEADAFVQLVTVLRDKMDALPTSSANNGRGLLTVTCSAGPEVYRLLRIQQMTSLVDFWNLMAFDYSGSWSRVSGHLANIYPSKIDPTSTPFNTDDAVRFYLDNGISPQRLVLGIPMYGRAFLGTQGLGRLYRGVGSPNDNGSWESGVWDYKALPQPGARTYCDEELISAWTYDNASETLISYDSPESATLKAKYVLERGLGGVMWWEISGDKTDSRFSLANVVAKYFAGSSRGLDKSVNQLHYS